MLKIIEKQREFFNTHKTLNLDFRILQLKRLRLQISQYYGDLCSAFIQDLNKPEFDVLSTEIGIVENEISYMIKHLKKWTRLHRKRISLMNFGGRGYTVDEPYGVVLIVSPWNYPLHLTLMPLVAAIAGGNTMVVKPSRKTPRVTKVIKKILSVFEDKYVYVVTKEEDIKELFSTKFDFIFYTGSKKAGEELMQRQSQFLTPMVLELGGKCPCIIDDDADIDRSAKRVVWGKFLNAGQTCVAPDYVLLHTSIKDRWLACAMKYIKKFYYDENGLRHDFVHIINKDALTRLQGLIDKPKVLCGGKSSGLTLEPTILTGISRDDEIMKEEIFGPILPVLDFDDLDSELKVLSTLDKPLALYYFGDDKESINKIINFCQSGGQCINDVMVHLSEENLPFGGMGASGFGAYHGKRSFHTFTHEKSVLKKSYKYDSSLRYPPATKKKVSLLKRFFKV